MKAIIYARVSSTTDRQSTERQVNDLLQYATAYNMEVTKVFEEHISGAKKNEERPQLIAAIDYAKDPNNGIGIILCSELSRLGRNVFEVQETIKIFIDNKINLYLQKEQLTLLNEQGKPAPFAAIMITVLATCAELERENIKFRLNSGRQQYIDKGGKLGRKEGSVKSIEQYQEEYKQVIKELKKGTSIRRTAKLCDVSPSTVQHVKERLGL